MYGLLRAAGFAAAFTMTATIAAAPSIAAGRQAYEASDVLTVIPKSLPVAGASAAIIPATRAVQPVVVAPAAYSSVPAPFVQPKPITPRRPLRDLVISFVDYGNQDEEQLCLARAVYFEARGESLEGQLAVAEVVLNRTASGVYPSSICGVVTQPAQFSFIRRGQFPSVNRADPLWRQALAISDIAKKNLAEQVAPNVLWYHATYVAPSWGRRLTRVAQIGSHIFYS
jgi:hypothetical protein